MKDNALRIFLFCYIVSGCLAAGEVLIAGPLGIQYVGFDGEPAGPQLAYITNQMNLHGIQERLLEAQGGLTSDVWWERAYESLRLGVDMTVELFKLLVGLYVFDLLTIFGIPYEITAVVQAAYTVLLARAMVGYLPVVSRGVQAAASALRAVRPGG